MALKIYQIVRTAGGWGAGGGEPTGYGSGKFSICKAGNLYHYILAPGSRSKS